MAEVAVRLWSEQWEAAEARRSADKSLMLVAKWCRSAGGVVIRADSSEMCWGAAGACARGSDGVKLPAV